VEKKIEKLTIGGRRLFGTREYAHVGTKKIVFADSHLFTESNLIRIFGGLFCLFETDNKIQLDF